MEMDSIEFNQFAKFSIGSFVEGEIGHSLRSLVLPLIECTMIFPSEKFSNVKPEDLQNVQPLITELARSLKMLLRLLCDFSEDSANGSSRVERVRNEKIENLCYQCFDSSIALHQFSWEQ